MKRRKFLSTSAATLGIAVLTSDAQSQTAASRAGVGELVRPAVLRPGDTIGIITPGTYVSDPDRLALVSRTLNHFGLRMKFGKNTGKRMSDYVASVDERLDDLHGMFRDREVRGIFCLRGGYGAMHLLDRIDYDLIRREPKVFLGYSDITALHLAIHKRANLVTFHGPVVLSRFTDYTQAHLRRALFDRKPLGALTNPPETNALRPAHSLRTIIPGTVTGRLTGGNLSLISATLGTPFEIETEGKLLFLEDVDEEPYAIDRMLTQLRLAGKFDRVAGVIFGECDNCRARDFKPSSVSPYSLGETLDNILGALRVPVLYGLTIGHTDDHLTLPLGVRATLDAVRGTLDITEAGVV